MLPIVFLKLIRKVGKLLRGASKRQVFLGGLLGVVLGMVPGFNLTLVVIVFLLLILNANVGIALLGYGIGKVLCLLLAPLTFQIGYALIHQVGLEGLFRTLADTPVLALLDLHVYCLVGGIPIGIVVGIAFGAAIVRILNALRKGLLLTADRTQRMRGLSQNKLVRVLMWLAFGPQKGSLAEMIEKKPPLLRKSGLILASLVVVVILVLDFLLLDYAVKTGLERGLSAVNGAEVNIRSADLSLLGGKLDLRGLQVTNSDQPTHNLLQVERLSADVSINDLLAKRLAIDLLEATGVRSNVERKSPGRVLKKPKEEREAKDLKDSAVQYFEKVKTLRNYLAKLNEYLEKARAEKAAREEKERLLGLSANRGYLSLSAQDILAKHPSWRIRKVLVDNIVLQQGGKPQKFEGSELSSDPKLNPKPMTVTLTPEEGGPPTVALDFRFHEPGELHRLVLNLRDVAIGQAVKLSDKVPLSVENGLATVEAAGGFSSKEINVPFRILVKNLEAQSGEGRSVLGLDPTTTKEAFKHLEEFELAGTVFGTLDAPRLKLDEKQMLSGLKNTLLKAGKAELANRVNSQLEKVTAEMSKKVQEALGDKLPVPLPGGLEGILPGLGKKGETEGEKEQKKQEEKKPTPGDLLERLF